MITTRSCRLTLLKFAPFCYSGSGVTGETAALPSDRQSRCVWKGIVSNLQHILVVDNDPVAAMVTQQGLQRLLGKDVEVALAPSPGAAWLRCMREAVDLLIVDPSPPSRAAAALIKALHDERPHIPVVVLTAYDTPRLRAQMKRLGVRHYLAKPVGLAELKNTVSGVLALTDAAQASPAVN